MIRFIFASLLHFDHSCSHNIDNKTVVCYTKYSNHGNREPQKGIMHHYPERHHRIIQLIRHFPVRYSFRPLLRGTELEQAMKDYDKPELLNIPTIIPTHTCIGTLYSSDLNRARITAELLFKQHPITDSRLREFLFEPVLPSSWKLPGWLWGVLGRYFASKKKNETFRAPIAEFLEKLLATNTDATIVCHGYVMYVLQKELLRRGFSGKRFLTPKHAIPYVYNKI